MLKPISDVTIAALITKLASRNASTRREAHETIVDIGKPVVASLITALNHPDSQVRWEAANALGEIGDSSAGPALVKSLEDEAIQVRWRAGESLMIFKEEGLTLLLQALIQGADSAWLRDSAQHVLRGLARKTQRLEDLVTPVLTALKDVEPRMAVPRAAATALKTLADQTADRGS